MEVVKMVLFLHLSLKKIHLNPRVKGTLAGQPALLYMRVKIVFRKRLHFSPHTKLMVSRFSRSPSSRFSESLRPSVYLFVVDVVATDGPSHRKWCVDVDARD